MSSGNGRGQDGPEARGEFLGAVGGASGVLLSSSAEGMPSGPIIIIVSGVFFTISLVFSPIRGMVAAARTRRLQIQQVVRRIEENARV